MYWMVGVGSVATWFTLQDFILIAEFQSYDGRVVGVCMCLYLGPVGLGDKSGALGVQLGELTKQRLTTLQHLHNHRQQERGWG
jgi:hypothetical protein